VKYWFSFSINHVNTLFSCHILILVMAIPTYTITMVFSLSFYYVTILVT